MTGLDDRAHESSRLHALAEAGSRHDAAVREVWAGIDPSLGTQQSWRLARPGMVAAPEQLDADLIRIRAEHGAGEPAARHSWRATADERTERCGNWVTTATRGGVPCGMPKAIEYRRAGRLAIAEHVPPCGAWEAERIPGEFVPPAAQLARRPLTLTEQTIARLASAGIRHDDPALARIRAHNRALQERTDDLPGAVGAQKPSSLANGASVVPPGDGKAARRPVASTTAEIRA